MKLNIKIGEIYTFKMNSSEEVLGKVAELGEDHVKVENPVSLGPTPNGQVGLIPSLLTYDHNIPVTINTNSIAMIAETEESIKNKYVQATTGLKLPDRKVLLG